MQEVNALAELFIKNVGCDLPGIKPGDYKAGKDQLWHCGVCHEPMQKVIDLQMDGYRHRVVRCQCRCEKERYEKEEADRKLQADREVVAHLRSMSLMDEKFRDSTFDRFQVTKDNERPRKLCFRYASAFKEMQEKNQGLLFWGRPGTGKTYAAACIANYLLDAKQPVVMTSFVKLISELQNPKGEDEETVISRLNRAALLIIDDLGAERSTDYALERVYNIVDSRYRAKRPMLLTTNLTLNEMQTTGDIRYARIYDRVFEVCYPIEFQGNSWRYEEAARRYDEMEAFLEG